MPFVTRAEWGARPTKSAGNLIGAHPKGVAIHYEGPKMGSRDHSKCDAMVRGIQDFHMDGRGWVDIAYSFAVCEHGYVYEGRGVKRGSAANGTTAANLDYYAVCGLVGEGDATPNGLLTGIRDAVDLCRRNGAGDALVGHRDLYATACPGTALYAWMRQGCPRPAVSGGGGQDAPIPAQPVIPTPTPFKPTPAPRTDRARVAKLQGLLEVTADGVWGATTDEWALRLRTAARAHVGYPKNTVAPFRIDLTQKVIDATPDNQWGPKSQAALVKWVKDCQTVLGVGADGSWGPGTDAAFVALRNANHNKF